MVTSLRRCARVAGPAVFTGFDAGESVPGRMRQVFLVYLAMVSGRRPVGSPFCRDSGERGNRGRLTMPPARGIG